MDGSVRPLLPSLPPPIYSCQRKSLDCCFFALFFFVLSPPFFKVLDIFNKFIVMVWNDPNQVGRGNSVRVCFPEASYFIWYWGWREGWPVAKMGM